METRMAINQALSARGGGSMTADTVALGCRMARETRSESFSTLTVAERIVGPPPPGGKEMRC